MNGIKPICKFRINRGHGQDDAETLSLREDFWSRKDWEKVNRGLVTAAKVADAGRYNISRTQMLYNLLRYEEQTRSLMQVFD